MSKLGGLQRPTKKINPPKINPFMPNQPAPIAIFAGRLDEIEALENGLYQTKMGYSSNYLITGERGIGKSSLLTYIKSIASGEVESPDYEKFNFLPVYLAISDRTDITTLVKLMANSISRELGKIEKPRFSLEKLWEFAQRITIMDSGIKKSEKAIAEDLLIEEFIYYLSETCKRVTDPNNSDELKDGILFLIDEVDNANTNLRIGHFFKYATELLQINECNNVMFTIAGLPDTIERLTESHESSIRIFNHIYKCFRKERY